jgi:dynein heavy chain
MAGVAEEACIQDLAEKDGIRAHFTEANKKLDKIQKKLSEYLEQKKLVFARFFFLADEDLLQILSQTKDPRLVQSHMDKCFEGISKVQFDAQDCVYGMISAEQEIVGFNKKIDVNEGDKKGNVENWMLEIEAQMIASLRKLAKDSLGSYPTTARTAWSKMYPGQIVLAISQIYWTKEVEQAILDHENDGLAKYIEKCTAQINDIVVMVRTPLKTQERITLKALVVIDVHARDVVMNLSSKNIQSVADFEWTAQLRYYWEEKDALVVKMVTAEIPYAYEYLGNSNRLVITVLTDRCYRTLLGAKYLNYGGAPEGPAGTGKTESVKDLAKAIAVQCVVFNCSDGLDHLAMAKFFKGLAASGAWCCFDEFNRVDLEVLSVIA